MAVIIMVLAHVTDGWTRIADRERALYGYCVFIAGFAAPLFLFLAGLTLSMAASSRAEKVGFRQAAALARWRGLQVFGLAFLFRLQSQLLGWGPLINFLKVDILNVMGLAMLGTAVLWGWSSSRRVRIALCAIATGALAMSTPLVREASWLAVLPDPIEAYLRPLRGLTSFAVFPWAAFVCGGAIAGEVIHAARTETAERRLQVALLASGLAGAVAAYLLSFRPSIYANANFWTSSPTFFFIRLGFNTLLLPVAWAIDRFHAVVSRTMGRYFFESDPGRFVSTLGRSSLFVYWIHVEMVYGVLGRPLRRALPIELSLVATVALCALLYVIVGWKNDKLRDVRLTGPLKVLSPVLK